MLHLHIASSKLLCSNAPHNTLRGTLTRLHLEVYKFFKGNFADARISFLIKARQKHRELRSLPVTKKIVPCLLICVFMLVLLKHLYSLLFLWMCVYVWFFFR